MWGSVKRGNRPWVGFWFWHTSFNPNHSIHVTTNALMAPPLTLMTVADTADNRNEAEPTDISSALDVEQLDLNLYRSRNLSLNFDARGVFGGQVISQALVAATNCVKPEYTLHVRIRRPTAA
jgi:hypothetical protein